MADDYTENSLVEQPAIALFGELGWEAANCFYESFNLNNALLDMKAVTQISFYRR